MKLATMKELSIMSTSQLTKLMKQTVAHGRSMVNEAFTLMETKPRCARLKVLDTEIVDNSCLGLSIRSILEA